MSERRKRMGHAFVGEIEYEPLEEVGGGGGGDQIQLDVLPLKSHTGLDSKRDMKKGKIVKEEGWGSDSNEEEEEDVEEEEGEEEEEEGMEGGAAGEVKALEEVEKMRARIEVRVLSFCIHNCWWSELNESFHELQPSCCWNEHNKVRVLCFHIHKNVYIMYVLCMYIQIHVHVCACTNVHVYVCYTLYTNNNRQIVRIREGPGQQGGTHSMKQ